VRFRRANDEPAESGKHSLTYRISVRRGDDQRQAPPVIEDQQQIVVVLAVPMEQIGDAGPQQDSREEGAAARRVGLTGTLGDDGDGVADLDRRLETGSLDAAEPVHDRQQVVPRNVRAHGSLVPRRTGRRQAVSVCQGAVIAPQSSSSRDHSCSRQIQTRPLGGTKVRPISRASAIDCSVSQIRRPVASSTSQPCWVLRSTRSRWVRRGRRGCNEATTPLGRSDQAIGAQSRGYGSVGSNTRGRNASGAWNVGPSGTDQAA